MKSLCTIFILSGISLYLSSCVLDKRLHNPGYHVRWNGNHFSRHAEKTEKDTSVTIATDAYSGTAQKPVKVAQISGYGDTVAQNTETQITIDVINQISVSDQPQLPGKKRDYLVSVTKRKKDQFNEINPINNLAAS